MLGGYMEVALPPACVSEPFSKMLGMRR